MEIPFGYEHVLKRNKRQVSDVKEDASHLTILGMWHQKLPSYFLPRNFAARKAVPFLRQSTGSMETTGHST